MSIDPTSTLGELVAEQPARAEVLERHKIDYCCGGRQSLERACRAVGLDVRAISAELEDAERAPADAPDPASMSLTELADHIEQTHHSWLRQELPRLDALAEKVCRAHGHSDERLGDVWRTLRDLGEEMVNHMAREERVLFPMIRALEVNHDLPEGVATAKPIAQMEHEHEHAGAALERLRVGTDGYRAPEWACPTYHALLDGLQRLERDMHEHVHKENNVLFQRAAEREAQHLQAQGGRHAGPAR